MPNVEIHPPKDSSKTSWRNVHEGQKSDTDFKCLNINIICTFSVLLCKLFEAPLYENLGWMGVASLSPKSVKKEMTAVPSRAIESNNEKQRTDLGRGALACPHTAASSGPTGSFQKSPQCPLGPGCSHTDPPGGQLILGAGVGNVSSRWFLFYFWFASSCFCCYSHWVVGCHCFTL